MINMQNMIKAGVVGKGHGLAGAFYISDRSSPLSSEVKELLIGSNEKNAKVYMIEWHKMISNRPVVKCHKLSSRNDVDVLKHQTIWILRSSLVIDDDTEYCWSDLIGKKIKDIDGIEMGIISRVVNYGAKDIIRIEAARGFIGYLEIPFDKFYLNMDFLATDDVISLCVTKEIFNECWQE